MSKDTEFTENPELAKQEQLARKNIGDDKVDERMEQLANMSMDDTLALKQKADAVMANIATCLNLDVQSEQMQAIVKEYLLYSNFALSKLQGKSVVIDKERFLKMAQSIEHDEHQKAAFEQYGEGTASHFASAMRVYAENNL
ncbi:TipAS antibiotic-recognition domain-containing protein [Thalassotalea ponticola]|uniref:TipAS antibiotic-recognition domain-containing protein n=1 Tax=Thalassotalea ponticola TaxID=1523392 RepID=UPI0025B2B9C2|nr:TipAS antibiotic-recognition domain-containing protein [Thalassotalea ponticola]MDN3652071.1 TipAS antibiotic-recognition domain-containing protein [Thalassotalea ponticola]